MNEGSISAMARSAVLRTVRFWWNCFGPLGRVKPKEEAAWPSGMSRTSPASVAQFVTAAYTLLREMGFAGSVRVNWLERPGEVP